MFMVLTTNDMGMKGGDRGGVSCVKGVRKGVLKGVYGM